MTMKKEKVWVQVATITYDNDPMSPDELIAAIQQAVREATTDQPHHSAANRRTIYEKLVVQLHVEADHQDEECSGFLHLIGVRDESDYEVQRRAEKHQIQVEDARRKLAKLEAQTT